MKSKIGRPKGTTGPHKTPHLTKSQVDEIAQLYLTTEMTEDEIGSIYGKSGTCVRLNMRKKGIRRPLIDRRGYTVNDSKFSEPWTEEHSYWLGMLHADGHCGVDGYSVSLELKAEDEATIKAFAEFVGYTGELKRTYPMSKWMEIKQRWINSTGSYIVRFNSKQMHADLTKRGIVSRDKRIWVPPVGLRDYVRGIFDGNGSIVKGRKSGNWNWYYTGGLQTCEFLKGVWDEMGINSTLQKSTGCWRLIIKSFEGTIQAQKYMYENCTGPMMPRKAIFSSSEHLWSESGRKMPKSYGTQYEKDRNRYRVVIEVDQKKVRLGRYKTKGLAYSAYAKDSLRRFGKKSPFWKNLQRARAATIQNIEPAKNPNIKPPPAIAMQQSQPTTPSWAVGLAEKVAAIAEKKASRKAKTSFGATRVD